MIRRPLALSILSLAAALGACRSTDDIDPSTEQQVRSRIDMLATLRGQELASDIRILGGMMKPYSVPFLVDAMGGDSRVRVRAGCAQALGISQDGRAVEPLAACAETDGSPGVRYTAAFSLCLFRDPRGLPILFEALGSDDKTHRAQAIESLRELTGMDMGYRVDDPPEARRAAVARWEAWYRELGPQGAAAKLLPPGESPR